MRIKDLCAHNYPGMTTHRDFTGKSEQEFEYFYSCYSLLGFDPGSEPLSDLSIEPIVKQEGILHLTCNLYTVLLKFSI